MEILFLPPHPPMVWIILKLVDMVSSDQWSLLGTVPFTLSKANAWATLLITWHPTTDLIPWSRCASNPTRPMIFFPRIFRLSAQRFEAVKRQVGVLILVSVMFLAVDKREAEKANVQIKKRRGSWRETSRIEDWREISDGGWVPVSSEFPEFWLNPVLGVSEILQYLINSPFQFSSFK